jgi:hypothetical protein
MDRGGLDDGSRDGHVAANWLELARMQNDLAIEMARRMLDAVQCFQDNVVASRRVFLLQMDFLKDLRRVAADSYKLAWQGSRLLGGYESLLRRQRETLPRLSDLGFWAWPSWSASPPQDKRH